MKTIEFTKDHTYGGVQIKKGDKLDLDDERRASMLVKAGVAKAPKAEKKAED